MFISIIVIIIIAANEAFFHFRVSLTLHCRILFLVEIFSKINFTKKKKKRTCIGIKISQETKNKYMEAKRKTKPILPDRIAKIDKVLLVFVYAII